MDLPGYGHAAVAAGARESWGPLGETLQGRESLCGLLLIVDCRRGVGALDLQFLEWAGLPEEQVHVLLSKADKLPGGAPAWTYCGRPGQGWSARPAASCFRR